MVRQLCVLLVAVASAQGGCALKQPPPPLRISGCTLAMLAVDGGFRAVARFTLVNASRKTAAVTRIGYRGWSDWRRPLTPRDVDVYDVQHAIPPGVSSTIRLATTRHPGRIPTGIPARTPCALVAVRFADGSAWSWSPWSDVPPLPRAGTLRGRDQRRRIII